MVTMINGLTLLRSLGVQAFNIDPRRWHKIKTYLSKGTIEYPQISEDGKVIIDGRHRIQLIMQIYKVTDVPVFSERNKLNSAKGKAILIFRL